MLETTCLIRWGLFKNVVSWWRIHIYHLLNLILTSTKKNQVVEDIKLISLQAILLCLLKWALCQNFNLLHAAVSYIINIGRV